MKRIGITLSGGFVKGAVHIGFLKALEYKGISPSFITGVSAGALVGFLYSYGFSPDKIAEIGKQLSWKKIARPYFKGGLFTLKGLHNFLTRITGNPDISELKIPFAVIVVNLKTLKVEVKRHGPSVDFVIASCSIPPIFSPWKVGVNYYIDGGVRNCLPAEVTKVSGVELNICSNVNTTTENFYPESITNVLERTSLANVLENQSWRLNYCDIIINHQIQHSPFDFSNFEKFIEFGFKGTLKEIEKWL